MIKFVVCNVIPYGAGGNALFVAGAILANVVISKLFRLLKIEKSEVLLRLHSMQLRGFTSIKRSDLPSKCLKSRK